METREGAPRIRKGSAYSTRVLASLYIPHELSEPKRWITHLSHDHRRSCATTYTSLSCTRISQIRGLGSDDVRASLRLVKTCRQVNVETAGLFFAIIDLVTAVSLELKWWTKQSPGRSSVLAVSVSVRRRIDFRDAQVSGFEQALREVREAYGVRSVLHDDLWLLERSLEDWRDFLELN